MSKKVAKKAPKYTFYVKKAIQTFVHENDMMMGSDAYDAFNEVINGMLCNTARRCKDIKRKTRKSL